jgi:hypothetical protein
MRLQKYQAQNGNCLVPKDDSNDGELARWIYCQRLLNKKGDLVVDRKEKLDSIGFEWSPMPVAHAVRAQRHDDLWEKRFLELVQYQKEHGHCNVPQKSGTLGNWVLTQRSRHRHGTSEELSRLSSLADDQVNRLNSIGFKWEGDMVDFQWDQMLKRFNEYKDRFGNCLIPANCEDDPELGQWVRLQRKLFNKGGLLEARKEALDSIGFNWTPGPEVRRQVYDSKWEERFQELVEFKRVHSNCRVPSQRKAQGTDLMGLSSWVANQRMRRYPPANTTRARWPTPQHEIDRLDSIGFIWRAKDYNERWNNRFDRLKKYKMEHGDYLVPQGYEMDLELGSWVNTQRRQYKNKKLAQDRIERLEEIGFVWLAKQGWSEDRDTTFYEDKWNAHYEKLLHFYDENGHCFVPGLYDKDQSLGGWVSIQRRMIRDNKISLDRKKLFDDIGFVAELDFTDLDAGLLQRTWDDVFQSLLGFKTKYGHCRVPGGPSFEDQHLARWVSSQRTQFRKGMLPESRKEKLESVGLIWEPGHRGSWVLDKKHSQNAEGMLATTENIGAAQAERETRMRDESRWHSQELAGSDLGASSLANIEEPPNQDSAPSNSNERDTDAPIDRERMLNTTTRRQHSSPSDDSSPISPRVVAEGRAIKEKRNRSELVLSLVPKNRIKKVSAVAKKRNRSVANSLPP